MKQHSAPILIQNGLAVSLERVPLSANSYSEDWVQDLCFKHENLLPVSDIEPVFGGMIPICRELVTESGAADLIYVNEYGFITIGECKLWRNPEARRKVVGQVLDYAKDLSKWNYKKFETACLAARKGTEGSLFEIISEKYPEVEESAFTDNVQKNLARGRFILMIIGDGIRENMEEIANYIQRNGNLNFTLCMVELPVYKVPMTGEIIVTPRILAKTKEIERVIYRLEDHSLIEKEPVSSTPRPSQSITEQIFYERLETAIGKAKVEEFKQFLSTLNFEAGITPNLGRGKKISLNLKSADDIYNLASIQENGDVWFYAIINKTETAGKREVGLDYLKKLAELVGGDFYSKGDPWNWGVRKNGKYIRIDEYLKIKDKWKALMMSTLEAISVDHSN
jgi:hypothetical protein